MPKDYVKTTYQSNSEKYRRRNEPDPEPDPESDVRRCMCGRVVVYPHVYCQACKDDIDRRYEEALGKK
jgi:uncharacterized OB-fold protein